MESTASRGKSVLDDLAQVRIQGRLHMDEEGCDSVAEKFLAELQRDSFLKKIHFQTLYRDLGDEWIHINSFRLLF